MTTLLATKPSDPREISFAPHCFETITVPTFYVVPSRESGYGMPGSPRGGACDDEAVALEQARRIRGSVVPGTRTESRRIAWA